jgi:hypothetical protein
VKNQKRPPIMTEQEKTREKHKQSWLVMCDCPVKRATSYKMMVSYTIAEQLWSDSWQEDRFCLLTVTS